MQHKYARIIRWGAVPEPYLATYDADANIITIDPSQFATRSHIEQRLILRAQQHWL